MRILKITEGSASVGETLVGIRVGPLEFLRVDPPGFGHVSTSMRAAEVTYAVRGIPDPRDEYGAAMTISRDDMRELIASLVEMTERS